MALVPGHDIDLVALDLAARATTSGLRSTIPSRSCVVIAWASSWVEVELLGDLLVREVQAHEVQAGDPDPQRLVVAGEDGVGQVVEASATAPALVALAMGLGVIPAVLDDRGRASSRGQRTPSGQRMSRTVS